MSIAEFYIENGLDPSDPNHIDDFLARMRYENGFESDESEYNDHHASSAVFSGLAVATLEDNNHVLDKSLLDALARSNGYQILDTSSSTSPMASYKRHAVRLNFWLSTGTVGSYLKHPRQGKTQLFRRNVSIEEARQIFVNPRMHSGKGYRTTSRGPCRYGDKCYRADCWFDH